MAGRTVIVVDDGLATGATVQAAVASVRTRQPARLVVAVPVGPPSTCAAVRGEADQVIVLYEPEPFLAVGYHYRDFRPIAGWPVERLLQANWHQRSPGRGASRAGDQPPLPRQLPPAPTWSNHTVACQE
jgi:predicted phosphoribosyltransferase